MRPRTEGLHRGRSAAAVLLALSMLAIREAEAQCALANRPRPDFDGNCIADLAVGAPGEQVSVFRRAGVVQVLYGPIGARTQVFSAAECYLSQDGAISGTQGGEAFGSVLAWGDFNGDGLDDLAVGIPDYNPPYPIGGMPEAGMVYVIFGRPGRGLDPGTPEQRLVQHFVSTNIGGREQFGADLNDPNRPRILNVNQNTFDRFGHALAAGDFDGDGVDDLAIGTPGEEGVDGDAQVEDAGDVYVLYGRRGGLSGASRGGHDGMGRGLDAATAQGWSQNGKRIGETAWYDIQNDPQADDRFGSALAAGDFNGDGRADLAIGVPGELGGRGAVHVIYGSPRGLHPTLVRLNQFFHQDVAGIPGASQPGEWFGYSLAAGNFGGSAHADLAVGAPRASVVVGGTLALLAGEVNVIYGSIGGLDPIAGPGRPAAQRWVQGDLENDGTLGGEMFGFALATGNFDGVGPADLAIGAPHDSPGNVTSAGAVNVMYGSPLGLDVLGNQYLHQDTLPAGLAGKNDPHGQLGRYLAVGDFNGNGVADLAMGVPGEFVAGVIGAGAVNVAYGGVGGLALPGEIWDQTALGVPGGSRLDESFGVLTAGRR